MRIIKETIAAHKKIIAAIFFLAGILFIMAYEILPIQLMGIELLTLIGDVLILISVGFVFFIAIEWIKSIEIKKIIIFAAIFFLAGILFFITGIGLMDAEPNIALALLALIGFVLILISIGFAFFIIIEWIKSIEIKTHSLLTFSGSLALVFSVVLLIMLITHIDVYKPGYYHLADYDKVIILRSLVWLFGLLGGILIGWGTAIKLRARIGTSVQSRRRLPLLILGFLLVLWSIERMTLGIAPEFYRYGFFYGFSAVISAIIMIIIITFGGFLITRGLSSIPRGEGR